jgi:hypothetical protein
MSMRQIGSLHADRQGGRYGSANEPLPRPEPLPPSPELKEQFEASRMRLGFVPNSMLIMQRKPKMVKAWTQLVELPG